MDLREEVCGTTGTIWLNHWLRTGLEIFTAAGQNGYVSEKTEGNTGWLFPVGDEVGALGYLEMFTDMFNALDNGTAPKETFYDGYVVNAIIDAAYASIQSKSWQPVKLKVWRGRNSSANAVTAREFDAHHMLVKEERMPDGSLKHILRHKKTGAISQRSG
jgi:hypothetical protein